MLIEHRAYTLKAGALEAFWAAQRERGFELVKPIMERLIGYFSASSGPTDQVVHLYRFDSYADWVDRLQGLYLVPELQPYFAKARAMLTAQENKFLAPAPVDGLTPYWGNGNDWLPATGAGLGGDSGSLVEESVLQLVPGALPKYWELCRSHGLPSGCMAGEGYLGCFYTVTGRFHQVIEYHRYLNFDARQERLARLRKDKAWQEFLAQAAALSLSSESKLLSPSPIKQMVPLFR